jgi:protein involved in polysaccharide export with SLBB domain
MKQSTGFRLTPEARALLDAMSKANGISHTAMLELLIREGAKKRGVRADSGIQTESQSKPTERDS